MVRDSRRDSRNVWRSLLFGVLLLLAWGSVAPRAALASFPYECSRCGTGSNSDVPSSGRSGGSRGGGVNILFVLQLIDALNRTGTQRQASAIDPCELSDLRSDMARLYVLLARQYLIQDEYDNACTTLDVANTIELESYTCQRLARQPSPASTGCHASELARISALTGSPTGLVYPVFGKDQIELLFVPPAQSAAPKRWLDKLAPYVPYAPWQYKLKQSARGSAPTHRVIAGVTPDRLTQTIVDLRDNLRDTSSRDYLPQAQQLYDWLIRPIAPDLEAAGIKTLVFAASGPMRSIPPAVLHDGKQFLIEKYAPVSVVTMPLTDLQPRDRNTKILAMGLSEAVQGFAALPAAKVEVETIGSQAGGSRTFLNQDFTIANLQQQQANFGIIHLATHAQLVSQRAKESFILFWDDKLAQSKLPELGLKADMLTLSACQTAVGKDLGLSGVAVESGARSVLASLWSVSDVGTFPLMVQYYNNLRSAPSKAIALQQSQLALLRGAVTMQNGKISGVRGANALAVPNSSASLNLTHPYYWSAFILVGSWL